MALTKVSGTGLKDDCITSAHMSAVITNADIASNAAIALSKLASTPTTLSGSTNNQITTVTGSNAIQGEANLTFDGHHLTQTLDTDGEGFNQTSSANIYIDNVANVNRTVGNGVIWRQTVQWNGTEVTNIKCHAGTDTTNKDDGYITFWTSSAANSSERLRITSDGEVVINDTSAVASALFGIKVNPSTHNGIGFRPTANGSFGALRTLNAAGSEVCNIQYDTTNANINFRTSNTQKATITSGGNVGIGTASPSRQFVVNANSANTFIRIQSSDTGNAGLEFGDQSDSVQAAIYQNASDNSLRFNGYNNSERLRITSGGLLHAGDVATTNTWGVHSISLSGNNDATFAVPATLNIAGGTAYNTANMAGGGIRFVGKFNSSNSYTTFAHIGGVKENTDDGNYAGALTFHTRNNGGNGAERLRIASDGKVGIGTDNPGYNLDIKHGTSARVAIDCSTGSDATITMDGINADFTGSDYYSIKAQSTGEFAIFKASAERLRIQSDGNIGVGGTAPNYQFHCTSSIGIGGHGLNNQQLSLANNAIQSLNLGVGYTSLLLNKDGGNVGIGTASPNERVHIHTASSLKAQQQFTNTTTGTGAGDGLVIGITGDESAILWNQENTHTSFGTNNIERLRITAGGQVNLGAASPTASENGQFNCYTTTSSGKAQFVHDAGTGGLRLAGTGSGSGANLVFSNNYNSGTFSDHWTFSHNGGDDSFRVLSGGTGGTERLRIGTYGEIGVAGAGSINFGSAGQVLTSGGNSAGCQWKTGAKILQVVHTQSTTQSSLGQNTWHEVLEASITPSSTSSKILIQGMITFSENAGDVHVRIYLDNDGAHIGSGSASGQGTSSHSSGSCGRGAWDCTTNPVTYLHSPNSTSSRTYSIRAMCSNGSFKLNRQINGNQNHANDNAHSTNLVLMEVAA